MLLAFGDSHHNRPALKKIAKILQDQKPEVFVHTGDNFSDFVWLKKITGIPGFGVRGNCDLGIIPGAKDEIVFDYRDKKIWLVHGHQYGVKYSTQELWARAKQLAVQVVVFGHTHSPMVEQQDDIWLVNPGSIPLPRGGSPGYARLTVENDVKLQLVQVK